MYTLILSLGEKLLKSKDISEDDEKKFEKKIQIITDDQIKKIDENAAAFILQGAIDYLNN